MKMRIKGNSIRLRLLRSEVEQLARGQRIEETISFGRAPEEHLTYSAEISHDEGSLRVSYTPSKIIFSVPLEAATLWAASNEVGIYETIEVGPNEALAIAIEKDFACLDRAEKENTDTYAHPKETRAC